MTLEFLSGAIAEFYGTVGYFRKIDPAIARRFKTEVQRVLGLIEKNPERYRKRTENFRQAKLRNFSYHLVYFIGEKAIVIVALAHERRKPGYWINRVD